jgi:hypothetical protein
MATGRAKVGVDTASTADDAAAADDAATAEPVLVEVVEPFQINDGAGNVYGPGETALLPPISRSGSPRTGGADPHSSRVNVTRSPDSRHVGGTGAKAVEAAPSEVAGDTDLRGNAEGPESNAPAQGLLSGLVLLGAVRRAERCHGLVNVVALGQQNGVEQDGVAVLVVLDIDGVASDLHHDHAGHRHSGQAAQTSGGDGPKGLDQAG